MPQGSAGTLGKVLRQRADASPERRVFSFLSYGLEGPPSAEHISYGQLLDRARAIAAQLRETCATGDRVVILCQAGMDYIAAFYGCVMGGMVAVPINPPRNAKHMERIKGILADAGASNILTTSDLKARIPTFFAADEPVPTLIALDQVDPGHAEAWSDPDIGPEALAFLQYTSGTTGTPKGVMVPHRQLLNNVESIIEVAGLDASSTMGLWLPPFHDMGLIAGLICGVYGRFPTILMAPIAFVERPARWLEAMSDGKVTITTAPNFGYQLCVDRVRDDEVPLLDLSHLRSALSGAERVRHGTMAAFAGKFAPAGFRLDSFHPVYGMAENVLITSGRQQEPGPRSFVVDGRRLRQGEVEILAPIGAGCEPTVAAQEMIVTTCGLPITDHSVRIVDPETGQACPSGTIGEIWVRGPSVAAGYWDNPAATHERFEARIEGGAAHHAGAARYLRSGDLGTLIDGEVCVLGRIKEMVIIRGRNYYAQDIEATVAAAQGGAGQDGIAAFGLDQGGEEHLVVVEEYQGPAPAGAAREAHFAAIRRAVLAEHELDVAAIVLVTPRSLPRTTSAKLRRGRTREMFVAGELASIAQWTGPALGSADAGTAAAPVSIQPAPGVLPDSGEPIELVRGVVADVMKMPLAELSAQTDFVALGVDSLRAAEIVFRLSERRGKRFPIDIIFDAATIADLAQAISGQRQDVVRPLRTRSALRVSVAKTEDDFRRIAAARGEVFAKEYGGPTGKPAVVSEWDRQGQLLFIEDSGAVVAGLLALTHTYPFADPDFYYDRFVSGASMAKIFEDDDVVLEMAQLFSVDRSTATLEALFGGVRALVGGNPVIQSRKNASVRCFYGALTGAHALMYREMLSDTWHNFTHIEALKADVFGLDPLHIVAEFRAEPQAEAGSRLPRSA